MAIKNKLEKQKKPPKNPKKQTNKNRKKKKKTPKNIYLNLVFNEEKFKDLLLMS